MHQYPRSYNDILLVEYCADFSLRRLTRENVFQFGQSEENCLGSGEALWTNTGRVFIHLLEDHALF